MAPTFSTLATALLATNEPPSEAEEAVIRAVVKDTEIQINQAYDEMLSLEMFSQAARQKHSELVEFKEAHMRIMSSVRRLSPDVLLEIMNGAMEADSGPSVVTLKVAKGPWLYGSVCRFWRMTSISSSLLWCNISIPAIYSTQRSLRRNHIPDIPSFRLRPSASEAILQTILDRSKQSPLTIEFGSSWDYPITPDPELLQMLIVHSARWRDVTLRLNKSQAHQISTSLPQALVPQLERANLRPYHSRSGMMVSSLQIAPLLHSLSATERLPEGLLPYSQITYLHLYHSIGLDDILSILRLTLNIETCYITTSSFSDALNPSPGRIIRLARLKHLIVMYGQIDLCSYLEAPALVEIDGISSLRSLRSLVSFLQVNPCRLKGLVFTGGKFTASALSEISASAPMLTSLTIRSSHARRIQDTRLIQLLGQTDNVTFFPKLQHLTIQIEFSITREQAQSVINIIRSMITSLKHLTLDIALDSSEAKVDFKDTLEPLLLGIDSRLFISERVIPADDYPWGRHGTKWEQYDSLSESD
ncbi:hypothetical protein C8J56DRAFT_1084483 [Mycena floridula]|nr:hypothetical protein C8J56DRAFT_1084483 [Mycena floridula]